MPAAFKSLGRSESVAAFRVWMNPSQQWLSCLCAGPDQWSMLSQYASQLLSPGQWMMQWWSTSQGAAQILQPSSSQCGDSDLSQRQPLMPLESYSIAVIESVCQLLATSCSCSQFTSLCDLRQTQPSSHWQCASLLLCLSCLLLLLYQLSGLLQITFPTSGPSLKMILNV